MGKILKRPALLEEPTRKATYEMLGDLYKRKSNYAEAVESYEKAGVKPGEDLLKKTYSWLITLRQPGRLRKIMEKEGWRPTKENVEEEFKKFLQGYGPDREVMKYFKKELGNKSDSIIYEAYREAMKAKGSSPAWRSEEIFKKTKRRWEPKTKEDRDLVQKAYNSIFAVGFFPALSRTIKLIEKGTGIPPGEKGVYDTGKEIAQEVARRKVHPDYLKEFLEVTGIGQLAPALYKIANVKLPREFKRSLGRRYRGKLEKMLGSIFLILSVVLFGFGLFRNTITGYVILDSSGNINPIPLFGLIFLIISILLFTRKRK